eukprot:15243851-Alexandrium_andersonii.AAC.1
MSASLVGSEMCIRDSSGTAPRTAAASGARPPRPGRTSASGALARAGRSTTVARRSPRGGSRSLGSDYWA